MGVKGDRRYTVVLYGATGFTGSFISKELVNSFDAEGENRPWAIAGRTEAKLKKVVAELVGLARKKQTIEILVADSKDDASLKNMAAQCTVVINCVGPFSFYGEQVIKACIESKTNYVDIAAEPEFLESMQLKYHDQAVEAGVAIVGACGFDSIPCDVGLEYLRQEFPGKLTSAESYVSVNGVFKGHYATYESIMNNASEEKKLPPLRKQIFPDEPKYEGKPLPDRGQMFFSNEENRWTMPFAGPDASVVKRSQYYLSKHANVTPIRFNAYFCLPSKSYIFGMSTFGLFLNTLGSFERGRKTMLNNPKFFTYGVFSHEGPTKEEMQSTSTVLSIYGFGQSRDPNETKPVTKKMKIHCPDPGYTATSIFLSQSALTIVYDEMKYSGVLAPGAAFQGTKIMERLKRRGIRFELE